jgi:hypothetical protein
MQRAWKEVKAMSKSKRRTLEVDVQSLVDFVDDFVGRDRFIEKLIEHFGVKKILEQMTAKEILESLSPAKRRQLKRF